MLRCAMLCCAMLCCAMLFCAMLCVPDATFSGINVTFWEVPIALSGSVVETSGSAAETSVSLPEVSGNSPAASSCFPASSSSCSSVMRLKRLSIAELLRRLVLKRYCLCIPALVSTPHSLKSVTSKMPYSAASVRIRFTSSAVW